MKILVPVDFSQASKKALLFAAEISHGLHAEIHICHFYQLPLLPSGAPMVIPVDDALEQASQKRMNLLLKSMTKKYDRVKFTGSVQPGYAPDGIAARQASGNFSLIVMGAKSEKKVTGYSFGSTSNSVVRSTTCPVLTVQNDSKFNGINKVIFAADYGEQYFNNALQLIGLFKVFNPEICLVHVSNGKFDEEMEIAELDRFRDQLTAKSRYANISTRFIEDEDIFSGLMSVVNNGSDLFAISARNHTLFEKLFTKSLTKKIILQSSVPVLTLHEQVV